jgi:Fic-DOC domain mobile mystery protein B
MFEVENPVGATPIADVSDLIPTWVQSMAELNRVESENILHAQKKFLRGRPIDPSKWFDWPELQMIHRTMFGNVWSWAGKLRKSVTSIGVRPGMIPLYIAELCRDVASWGQSCVNLNHLEKAARVHHRLVYIHPFENGNGRFSRLVSDRCLLAWNCKHPIWPTDLNRNGGARKKYIQTLISADRGDYEPLIDFMVNLGAKSK